jgi:hypothetical protein
MSAPALADTFAEPRVSLFDAFTERAGARALLWAVGEFEMAEAVDCLQHDAERDGLVKRIGQDGVQAILARAFVNVSAIRRSEMES